MNKHQKFHCPNCHTHIDIDHLMKDKITKELEHDMASKYASQQDELNKKALKLAEEEQEFKRKKDNENVLFMERIQKEMLEKEAVLEAKRIKLETEFKQKTLQENAEQMRLIQQELNEKSSQVIELNKTKAEVERLKRENAEAQSMAEIRAQHLLTEQLQQEAVKIRKAEEEKSELKFKELEKQLDDQKKLTAEMIRKQDQGSMQLQGEVQELAIEEWLKTNFPYDEIEDIKKGAHGADCMQVVNTHDTRDCGKIYYESKRTKTFSNAWIEKFKQDIREKNANIGILVTEVMPSDMKRFGFRDGIWICTFEEFKGLSAVLRQSVIDIHHAVKSQENKGDKMVMLYDYLTHNEFRMQIEAIVEGFDQLRKDLTKEKDMAFKNFAKREKQLDKVIQNTITMYGSIRGIAGSAVRAIPLLEDDSEDDDEDLLLSVL